MKKNLILGSIILSIIAISVVLIFIPKNSKENLININGKELLAKLEQKENFILVISQEGCHFCEEYKPILNRILKEENLEAYELNLTELRKEEENIQNEVKKLFNVDGTPVTIFIQNGEEQTTINRIIGTTTYSNLKNKLKDRGFIN
ncbi:MAG: conjugal transfer protein TraF [Bacilli bacterium]|jgi:thioredoxin 1|nr:conjugal transfer protein TraF [Bacilli bacterium]